MSQGQRSHHIARSDRLVGYRQVAGPGNSPLAFLEFGLATIDSNAPLSWQSPDRETVVYLISGSCECAISGSAGAFSGTLDFRSSLFDGLPSAVFLPAGARARLTSGRTAQVAVLSALPSADRPPRLITGREVAAQMVGTDNWARRVVTVVDERTASRLLVGETINPPGNWSSYPPHKHDANVPDREVAMEEVYWYSIRPTDGFGLQMVYTGRDDPEPFEEIYRVSDGDTVVIPRGYHPVVAAAGYELAYLWAISGERITYAAWSTEPIHRWLTERRR